METGTGFVTGTRTGRGLNDWNQLYDSEDWGWNRPWGWNRRLSCLWHCGNWSGLCDGSRSWDWYWNTLGRCSIVGMNLDLDIVLDLVTGLDSGIDLDLTLSAKPSSGMIKSSLKSVGGRKKASLSTSWGGSTMQVIPLATGRSSRVGALNFGHWWKLWRECLPFSH